MIEIKIKDDEFITDGIVNPDHITHIRNNGDRPIITLSCGSILDCYSPSYQELCDIMSQRI